MPSDQLNRDDSPVLLPYVVAWKLGANGSIFLVKFCGPILKGHVASRLGSRSMYMIMLYPHDQ